GYDRASYGSGSGDGRLARATGDRRGRAGSSIPPSAPQPAPPAHVRLRRPPAERMNRVAVLLSTDERATGNWFRRRATGSGDGRPAAGQKPSAHGQATRHSLRMGSEQVGHPQIRRRQKPGRRPACATAITRTVCSNSMNTMRYGKRVTSLRRTPSPEGTPGTGPHSGPGSWSASIAVWIASRNSAPRPGRLLSYLS